MALCGTILLSGCQLLLPDEPEDTPVRNFDLLWHEFDAYYSGFLLKNINWDSLYTIYRPQVNDQMADGQLFDVMANLLYGLNDGHVALVAPFKAIFSNDPQKATRSENFNFQHVLHNYLGNGVQTAGDSRYVYSRLKSQPDLAYVYISSFEDVDFAQVDNWVSSLDAIIDEFADTKGLILDIRDNGGGDAFNANAIAGRFTATKNLYGFDRTRNGPAHDDFTAPDPLYIEPQGNRYYKPVVVLTNRNTASASERFLLAMRTIPGVQVVGDTTEGAIPHALPRELPNGWSYRVTVGIVDDAQGNNYEGRGIAPDFRVVISQAQDNAGQDPILDKAIELLK